MFQLHPPEKSPFPVILDDIQRARLNAALKGCHDKYDPAEQLLKIPFNSPGYHTTLKGGMVHPTRESFNYAVELFDTGDAELQKRGEAIVRKLLSLQDTNPASSTYGIWSWFYEEPLQKMAPPDWNWAEFCAVQLLQIALSHRERIIPGLLAQIDAAIGHASRSIIKRNVQPGYTNVAIMDIYVTLVAGELYDCAELRDFGLQHLKTFHAYTLRHGAFTEYNSPTYTVVALKEIGRLRAHARRTEAKQLIEQLYRVAWEEIAGHFHAPTRQWAGPHSRCYSTLLDNHLSALIKRATEGSGRSSAGDAAGPNGRVVPLSCPDDLERFFTTLDAPRELVKTFLKDEPAVIGTTYLAPQFCLGTVNRGDLWNQRRALVAYWGDAKAPSYLHLRFLRDGYDFSAAQFFSVQREGCALCAINFATDGGNTHICLDPINNATLTAGDFRLRFELGGAAGKAAPAAPSGLSQTAQLRFGDLRLKLSVPFARFGEFDGRWDAGQDKDKAWLDVVLYSGGERSFNLAEIAEAALGMMVSLARDDASIAPQAQSRAGRLTLAADGLSMDIPTRPSKVDELQKSFRASR